MPTYSIQGNDGKTYSIEGPEGATEAEVIAAIEAELAKTSRDDLFEEAEKEKAEAQQRLQDILEQEKKEVAAEERDDFFLTDIVKGFGAGAVDTWNQEL